MRTGVTEKTPAQAHCAAARASKPAIRRLEFMSEAHSHFERAVPPELARAFRPRQVIDAQHRDGPAAAPRFACVLQARRSREGNHVAESAAVHAKEARARYRFDTDESAGGAGHLDARPRLLAERTAEAQVRTRQRQAGAWLRHPRRS